MEKPIAALFFIENIVNMKKNFTNLLQFVAVSAIWLLIGWTLHSRYSQFTQTTSPDLVEKARAVILQDHYLDKTVTSQQLSYAAIRGMLAQTNDPKAGLFTPPISEYYAKDVAGEVGVSGVIFDVIDKKIVILDVPPGRPASQAGIKAGDIVLGINGIRFDENTSGDEASLLFRGPVGTVAHVNVQRGNEILEIEIIREELPIFVTKIISGEIGYLQQRIFPLNSDQKMQEHLQSLVKQKIQALIWDLRNSRGGSMKPTQMILNHFIAEGVFYSAEFRDGHQEAFVADGNTQIVDLPMVVLINERTYSSSEMAAIALAEQQRAVLIGTTTEGKGTIQDTVALDDQHLLRITVAKWLSPSGKWVQDKGVVPDITVIDDPKTENDEVLDFALKYIQQELLVKAKQ